MFIIVICCRNIIGFSFKSIFFSFPVLHSAIHVASWKKFSNRLNSNEEKSKDHEKSPQKLCKHSHHKSSVCQSLDTKLTIYLHMFLLLIFVIFRIFNLFHKVFLRVFGPAWVCMYIPCKKIVSSAYRLTIQVSGYHNNFPQDILLGWGFLPASRIGTTRLKWSGHKLPATLQQNNFWVLELWQSLEVQLKECSNEIFSKFLP